MMYCMWVKHSNDQWRLIEINNEPNRINAFIIAANNKYICHVARHTFNSLRGHKFTADTLDDAERVIEDLVEKHGWTVIHDERLLHLI